MMSSAGVGRKSSARSAKVDQHLTDVVHRHLQTRQRNAGYAIVVERQQQRRAPGRDPYQPKRKGQVVMTVEANHHHLGSDDGVGIAGDVKIGRAAGCLANFGDVGQVGKGSGEVRMRARRAAHHPVFHRCWRQNRSDKSGMTIALIVVREIVTLEGKPDNGIPLRAQGCRERRVIGRSDRQTAWRSTRIQCTQARQYIFPLRIVSVRLAEDDVQSDGSDPIVIQSRNQLRYHGARPWPFSQFLEARIVDCGNRDYPGRLGAMLRSEAQIKKLKFDPV
jgi:hypothetical protein